MRKTGVMVRAVLLMAGVAAIALPLYAQNIPPDEEAPRREPSRDRRDARDNADFDPEPYYIDGVEYKPYDPNGGKRNTPQRATATQPVNRPSAPVAAQPQGVGAGTPSAAPPTAAATRPASTTPYVDSTGQVVGNAPPVSSASQSSVATVVVPPEKRVRYGAAILTVLDKVTGEAIRFEAPVGKPKRYRGMVYTVKACETSAQDEAMSDTMTYLEVRTSPQPAANGTVPKPKDVFRGWTYASTPGVNGMEHPVYDVWVVSCRTPLPVTAVASR
ncbi:DUF2155 domain-containing protein [Asticcacaulis sp. DW145]|uniref:DUF2155 domain-containing protein n=1 Tax=Asticcacaulis currens TaxID=2984210 RepID=A0ABT5IGE6_9CAUL|nr:DUF2155 domain-containing protein [Asticcacaulis currens]MDC7695268.1 DUF2155 domain-containing protein [Asticcacaulis currens]BEV12519.1 DUF2155 domain-containing protein [Asticcacaulis sp. DW145]